MAHAGPARLHITNPSPLVFRVHTVVGEASQIADQSTGSTQRQIVYVECWPMDLGMRERNDRLRQSLFVRSASEAH
jgi:hypothetical protein